MSKTGGDIAAKIIKKVDDPSNTTDEALDFINECAAMLTGRILFSKLEAKATVDTVLGSNEVSLPSDYSRNLFYCMNVEQNSTPVIMGSIVQLRRYYPSPETVGRVQAVAESNSTLFYANIPSPVETLSIMYHRKPEDITDVSTPDFTTPENEYFVEMAMYHYGCYQFFDAIEDAEDGKQPNTAKHEAQFRRFFDLVDSKTASKSHRPLRLMKGCFL